ncbi:hypothetical protein [Frigoriglobus tundricola]|uniref:Uncharacterized protein n=1 Tax=Frigoriglobus tundricola TaxID=2774151 RepID=A0A6M5YRM8_9BACT|nr:hypothetical protein [Frigoriglobus tundricola]QJW96016.1 hypothetical protein FTUN_3570 [Frigoriglobus tundricola]
MRYSATALVAVFVASVSAQPPDPEPIPLPLPAPTPQALPLKAPKGIEQPKPEETAAIARLLREMALQKMPDALVKSQQQWGKQKEFAVGRVMLRNPDRLPDAPRALFNDGLWRRFTVTARDPAETLAVTITELVRPEENKLLVTLNVGMDINFRMEQQLWKRGLMLYSGETRGHCKGAVQLKAVVSHTAEFKPGALLPHIVLKVTTTEAKLFYDKLVIDHTAGLDGEDAKKVGDLVLDLVKSVKPDLEKQLLDKGNAAIVKAAGTKEVQVKLDKLMSAGVVPKK